MTASSRQSASRVVAFGEILLRLSAPAGEVLLQRMQLEPSFCGAEANVAVALAGFGHDVRMVTALPANPVGDAAQRALRGHGVTVQGSVMPASRLGLFYLQPGAMHRPAQVTYDRAHSAFAAAADDYDWSQLLDGADWLFVGGITAALGDSALAALHAAITTAHKSGVRVAFDTNFRPALWQGREGEAIAILRDLSCQADLLFAGRRAVSMIAGGNYGSGNPEEGFRQAARAMFTLSPRLKNLAATRREVFSSDRQKLTALLADRDGVSASQTIELENIVDRVGTGDAFAAGILHGLIAGMDRDHTVRFAAGCAAWAHSVRGDFMHATLSDIDALASGSGDVRR